ncbi:MAG: tetratricopeptide repeat protein [Candidatus Hydrogenedentes bacterium]|nr:tetratricopeptide repeat protein [Candidatus Hydrogenedentota bacterium]
MKNTVLAGTLVQHCIFLILFSMNALASDTSIEELVSKNKSSVLIIEGTRNDGGTTQSSGCIVHRSGLILTTAHQVDNIDTLLGRQSDGTTFKLSVVEVDSKRELALLRAAREFSAASVIGDARTLSAGALLVTIATPVNLDFSVATGIVSNTNRTFRSFPVIQAEITAAPGSSGGPVFDKAGEVVGLIMGVLEEQSWATIVIPINNAYSMLERHGLYQTLLPEESYEQNLAPVAGISQLELCALNAYNRGAQATDFSDKQAEYRKAVELLPDFYEAWFNLAVLLGKTHDDEGALQIYKQALTLRPESVVARRNLGRIYLDREEYTNAIKIFEEVVTLLPKEPQSFNDFGEAYRKAGRTEQAIIAFNQAIALDEQYANALYNLAIVHVQQNHWEMAYDAFERYLAAAPAAKDRKRINSWLNTIQDHLKN